MIRAGIKIRVIINITLIIINIMIVKKKKSIY